MFAVHFKLRYRRNAENKTDHNLPASIVYFVRIDGVESNTLSSGIEVLKSKWNNKHQRIDGTTDEVQLKNKRISAIRAGLDRIHQELCFLSDYVTAQEVLNVYSGKAEKQATLLKTFDAFLERLKTTQKEDERLKPKTLNKWEKAREHIESFLVKIKMPVMPMVRFTPPVCEQYRDFLEKKGFQKDHVSRNISYLKKVFKEAKRKGLIQENKIESVSCPRSRHKEPIPLDFPEIERLLGFTSDDLILQQCADIVVLMCFTGLDYCDYIRFNPSEHLQTIDGQTVIKITRLKMERVGQTPKTLTIPVLPETKTILEKYKGLPPILKYHTIRKNLKIIMRNIGVDKEISLKNLRKTFGTYLLNKGLRMEVVRDALGHETIALTERVYTVIYPQTIIEEFKKGGLL